MGRTYHGEWDYDSCERILGKRREKKVANNTRLRRSGENDDEFVLELHATDIARMYPDGRVRLNSGGYRSATTKNRMTGVTPQRCGVYQEKGVWYFYRRDENYCDLGKIPFWDGMIVDDQGRLTNPEDEPQPGSPRYSYS